MHTGSGRRCYYLGMKKPNWQSSSTQSGLTNQIRTRPRATKQGLIKCRCHFTIPAVPTQEAIPEEGGKKIYKLLFCFVFLCVWGWVGEKKICTTGFCWSKYLTFKGLSRDMRGHVLQEWGTSTSLLLYFLSILETEKKVLLWF